MTKSATLPCWLRPVFVCLMGASLLASPIRAQDGNPSVNNDVLQELEQALESSAEGGSQARHRLAVRRVIRNAEKALKSAADDQQRFHVLEFLFRARQQLVSLDDDPEHRNALLETCRLLIKAPDELAELRLEADLLLSQAEQAKKNADAGNRADALRPFVERYVGTPAGPKALRMTMLMALELGDTRLVNDLREMIAKHYSGDLEMIKFQRDHLGGQVFGVPFVGTFKRSDGKTACFPMDGLGHSTMMIFWSKKEKDTLQYLTDLAAASLKGKDQIDGRLEIISMNLDDLPDAGESIIRDLGVDWQVLHLPGGRDNPIYDAYVRVDPLNMRIAPTGQTAMMMREARPKSVPDDSEIDHTKIEPSEDFERHLDSFRRTLIRGWSQDEYAKNLSALITGDFLIFDPEGPIDPARPPELKAAAMNDEVSPINRTTSSLPAEVLIEIQDCLIPPPRRYHASIPEIRSSYQKMASLCREAIIAHPDAPDLWIVRNRLIHALIGLWKTDFDLAHFEEAVAESKTAMKLGEYPLGTDIIPRFCLTRQALRESEGDPAEIIEKFIDDYGGENAPGNVLAVASILALDTADEARFRKYRKAILENHSDYPMMWLYSAFLLDRYHNYWLFQVPFTAGWSFGRRYSYEMAKGDADEARRMLKTELPTMNGQMFRIPEDLESEYTVIYFVQPGPWRGNDREDTRPPSPGRMMRSFPNFVVGRPDVDIMVAMLGEGDEKAIRESMHINRSEEQIDTPILKIPGGMDHPLTYQLGLLSDDQNVIVVDDEGRVMTVITGLAFGKASQSGLQNTVLRQDEKEVIEALERGDVQGAKEQIMRLAPPYDPEAVDDKGRKLKKPEHSLQHLRARARVYMALKQWDKALEDAEEVVSRQLSSAGGMSLRTDELNESEALRDEILEIIASQN